MASKFTSKTVAGAPKINLNYSEGKGRYLTASRELKAGTVIISEEAFAEIPIFKRKDHKFCHNCLKDVDSSPAVCHGCKTALYCSIKCQTSSWKRHHWLECFMPSLLATVSTEAKMGLRTLLEAAHNTVTDTILGKIAQNLSRTDGSSHDIDANSYQGNYWSIYCLQRHENESAIKSDFKSLYPEIQHIAEILSKCFKPYHSVEESGEKKVLNETKLKSVFKKLSFSSYYNIDDFDIRDWKTHVEECCKAMRNSGSKSRAVSVKEIFAKVAHSEKELLERLLIHHALQVRTNGQAVFRICETKERSRVQDTTQVRIATGFFPVTSLMNHSCSPNTSVSFNGKSVTVVASKLIRKGEEICHCYGPHYSRHTIEERQKLLKQQYFFDCECDLCLADLDDTDEGSFNMQFHAFKCKYCGEPLKPDKMSPSEGTCINEECGKTQDISQQMEQHFRLLGVFEDVAAMIDDGSVNEALKKLKTHLKIAEGILHSNHIDIARLHDATAQCYVLLHDYQQAVIHLNRSIFITGMVHGAQSVEMAHELQKVACVYFNHGNMSQAGKFASRVMSIYKIHYHEEDSFPPGSDEMKKIIEFCG